MSIIAVTGDASTTTALALAMAWPHDALLIEADPRGGILAGWLGVEPSPSLSDALVAANTDRHRPDESPLDLLLDCARALPHRSQVVVAPIRPLEAAVASTQLCDSLLARSTTADHDIIVDRGALDTSRSILPGAIQILVHRQIPMGLAGAAARIEQLSEHWEHIHPNVDEIILVVIGDTPFDPADIALHLGSAPMFVLPDDRFAASVLCGRSRCSRRRFENLPLMRAAAAIGHSLADAPTAASSRGS